MRGRKGRREKREGGSKREEKGIKILHVFLTFWNDFILTVSRRIR